MIRLRFRRGAIHFGRPLSTGALHSGRRRQCDWNKPISRSALNSSGNLLLRVVDGSDDRSSELLQAVGKLVLLRSGLASLLAALSLSSDAAIGIETTERAVALVQDAATLFDERLNVVDKLLLVELVARCAVGLLDILKIC